MPCVSPGLWDLWVGRWVAMEVLLRKDAGKNVGARKGDARAFVAGMMVLADGVERERAAAAAVLGPAEKVKLLVQAGVELVEVVVGDVDDVGVLAGPGVGCRDLDVLGLYRALLMLACGVAVVGKFAREQWPKL